MIEVYTDGGCHGNGKANNIGGNGFIILINKEYLHHTVETAKNTTNNREEIKSVINALKWLNTTNPKCSITIYSDSQYVVKGLTIWSIKWKLNNWKRSKNSLHEIKNSDLWKELITLYNQNKPKIKWVKGHSTSEWNVFIDRKIQESLLLAK